MNGKAIAMSSGVDASENAAAADPAVRVGALFDAHHQRLFKLARRLSRNSDDARDLVQETFLRAARSPASIRMARRTRRPGWYGCSSTCAAIGGGSRRSATGHARVVPSKRTPQSIRNRH